MKYVRNFLLFWRKFVVGDDSRIAVIIMWSLLFVYSLSLNFINAWFVLPLCVVGLLGYVTYDAILKLKPQTIGLLWSGLLPMVLVTALPPLLFRASNGTTDLQYTLLPLCLSVIFSSVCFSLAFFLVKRFPLLMVFLLGCASLLFITAWQSRVNSLSQWISGRDFGTTLTLIVTLLAVIGSGYLIRLSRRKKLLTNSEN